MPEFGTWLKAELNAMARSEGISLRKLLELRGANRANIYRWFKLDNSMEGPARETVDREFDRLGISIEERTEPYGYLGWTTPDSTEALSDLEGKRRRAEAYMRALERRGALTPELKAKYEAVLRSAERAYDSAMDAAIEEMEADLADIPRETDGGEGHGR